MVVYSLSVKPHFIKDLCRHKEDTIILANKHSESLFTHKNQKRRMIMCCIYLT